MKMWFNIIVTLSMVVSCCHAKTTLEVLVVRFLNPTGNTGEYIPCDSGANCDPHFRFCLDRYRGNGDAGSCRFAKHKSLVYGDAGNEVIFSDPINGGIANPILSKHDEWPGSVLFKFDAWENTNDVKEWVDRMFEFITLDPERDEGSADWEYRTAFGERLNDPCLLDFAYRAYCDVNYYGAACTVFCVPSDDENNGHYICNPDNGDKECLPGWTEPDKNCTVPFDLCSLTPCLNNAWCEDLKPGFQCHCLCGYTGDSCETDIDDCELFPCQNGGTCVDGVEDYTCVCAPGFTGKDCDVDNSKKPKKTRRS